MHGSQRSGTLPVMTLVSDLQAFDAARRRADVRVVAGIDEAGRGPLAGPVVAAAVILPDDPVPGLEGVNDSKKLTPAKRETLFPRIQAHAVAWSVGVVDAATIDRINILQATWRAMALAVEGLGRECDLLLVDGNPVKGLPYPQENVVKGDGRSASIAAASILAKVTRDRMMVEADAAHPGYGFAEHKGYGTKYHRAALEVFGPTPLHRRTFLPVVETLFPDRPGPAPEFGELWAALTGCRTPAELQDAWMTFPRVRDNLRACEIHLLTDAHARAVRRLGAG